MQLPFTLPSLTASPSLAPSPSLTATPSLAASPSLPHRYILIDWLSEVSEMKELPSPTFHLAVSLLNRYMLHRRVPMTQFQLLGITALLVAARWMGLTIITIREAAWLTDYTYKYEEVVRRMGELVAALRGNLRVRVCRLCNCSVLAKQGYPTSFLA